MNLRVLSLAATALSACAASVLLHPGPTSSSLWISPVSYNHTLLGPVDGTADQTSFYVAQWDNVVELDPQNAVEGAGTVCPEVGGLSTAWHIATPSAVLCAQTFPDGTPAAYMAMDGHAAGSTLPCGSELDLFLSPTDGAYNAAQPPARVAANVNTSVPLSAMLAGSGLVASFQWQTLNATVTPRCGAPGSCGPSGQVDYAYLTLGLVLGYTPPPGSGAVPQTMFYQVIFYDTRGDPAAGGGAGSCGGPCTPYSNWFEQPAPVVGVSDAVSVYSSGVDLATFGMLPGSHDDQQGSDHRGGSSAGSSSDSSARCPLPCTGNAPCPVTLPVGQRLAPLLSYASTHFGLNGTSADWPHWAVTGMYVGLGGEGSVTAAVRVAALDLTY